MDQLDSSTIKGLTVFLMFNLAACVTPTLVAHKDTSLCGQSDQGHSKVNKSCHYYGSKTPYERKKQSSQVQPTLAAKPLASPTTGNELVISANPTPVNTKNQLQSSLTAASFADMQLSIGDKLDINILNGEEFSGEVEVNADGYIYLPYLTAINAQGLNIIQLKSSIMQQLLKEQLMLEGTIRLSITPLRWAPIEVTVSGAIFQPGLHLINRKSETELKDDDHKHSGDQASERSIPAALRASGGVSPDADLTMINLVRGDKNITVDFSGVMTGSAVPHFTLMANDHIHVPQKTTFDDELARPSQITAPGIRVFISNLTQPASSNSQSAVDTEATRFPYGTRLLTGVIGGNCVGGAQMTNASRHVLLITKNPLTKQVDVVERSIDGLIANSWRPKMNPILLPGDGIACYDSSVTNIREIARTVTEVLLPATLLGLL